jgi:hypothetical protein
LNGLELIMEHGCQWCAHYHYATKPLIGRFELALDYLVAAPCGRCKLGYTIAVAPMASRRSP